jgi:ribosomal protein S18 acetylase RimI-like enzyme
MPDPVRVRVYEERDFPAVERIWRAVFPVTAPYHEPAASVRRMVAQAPDLFFVAEDAGRVVGTVLAGWDGHRGWIYSLAVCPELQRRGIGSLLLTHALDALHERGCPKVNLQVLASNQAVVAFYLRHGFAVEERVSMGRALGP